MRQRRRAGSCGFVLGVALDADLVAEDRRIDILQARTDQIHGVVIIARGVAIAGDAVGQARQAVIGQILDHAGRGRVQRSRVGDQELDQALVVILRERGVALQVEREHQVIHRAQARHRLEAGIDILNGAGGREVLAGVFAIVEDRPAQVKIGVVIAVVAIEQFFAEADAEGQLVVLAEVSARARGVGAAAAGDVDSGDLRIHGVDASIGALAEARARDRQLVEGGGAQHGICRDRDLVEGQVVELEAEGIGDRIGEDQARGIGAGANPGYTSGEDLAIGAVGEEQRYVIIARGDAGGVAAAGVAIGEHRGRFADLRGVFDYER